MELKYILLAIFIWIALVFHAGIALELQDTNLKIKLGQILIKDQKALGDNQTVWTSIDKTASVLCQTNNSKPIQTCYWRAESSLVNKTKTFNVTESSVSLGSGYVSDWRNLSNGSCKITIEKVTKSDFGNWSCILIAKDHDLFVGTVQVSQWERPNSKPNIERETRYSNIRDLRLPHRGNNMFDAECCAHGGKPNPTLSFRIDNTTINATTHETFTGNNLTCITWKEATFTHEMNGKRLSCVMNHISFSDKDVEDHQHFVSLNIQFPPILNNATDDKTITINVEENVISSTNISVTARGNPNPKVTWALPDLGDHSNLKRKNYTDFSNSYFEIKTKHISIDEHESTLIIKSPLDLKSVSNLSVYASNEFGEAEILYKFVKNSRETGTEISNTIFIVVLCVVAVLSVILIAGAVGFWVRRRHATGSFPIERRTKPAVPKRKEISTPDENVAITSAVVDTTTV